MCLREDMLKTNEIHHGDCLELMYQISDHSIDMVLADLPYGTTACAWDSIIPLEPLWEHYKRIIKPRGAIVLTASQPFTSALVMSNLEWFKWEDIWHKTQSVGHLNAHIMPLRQHESILIFGKGKVIYNPQFSDKPKYNIRPLTGKTKNGNVYGLHDLGNHRSKPADVSYPRSVISFPNVNGNERAGHDTQKPVALFAYLIRTYTNPGDLVLDNAAGSGTTAIAAIDTGRNWLLIEKDPEYYQIAKDRITERLKQPFLPGLDGTAHNKALQPNGYPASQQPLFADDDMGKSG